MPLAAEQTPMQRSTFTCAQRVDNPNVLNGQLTRSLGLAAPRTKPPFWIGYPNATPFHLLAEITAATPSNDVTFSRSDGPC